MWLLGRILPILIGDWVDEDDEHWQLCLQLMEIVDILFCHKVTHDHAAYVASLINDHHTTFCELYPEHSVIPKMHFMVHMPKFMIRYIRMYMYYGIMIFKLLQVRSLGTSLDYEI